MFISEYEFSSLREYLDALNNEYLNLNLSEESFSYYMLNLISSIEDIDLRTTINLLLKSMDSDLINEAFLIMDKYYRSILEDFECFII